MHLPPNTQIDVITNHVSYDSLHKHLLFVVLHGIMGFESQSNVFRKLMAIESNSIAISET